jgi:hypothetical protein
MASKENPMWCLVPEHTGTHRDQDTGELGQAVRCSASFQDTQPHAVGAGSLRTSAGPWWHACNPSYLGGREREDRGSRPAQANGSQDPISKITRAQWTGGVAQAVDTCCASAKS